MRRDPAVALCVILPAALAAAQQFAPPAPPPASSASPAAAQPAEQTAYYAGPGLAAPELLPVKVTGLATGHCEKLDGVVTLAATVDGIARNVYLLDPLGNGLDRMALNLANADRFKPGTHEGVPAPVAVSIHSSLHACIEETKNETGQKVYDLRLRSMPDQKLDLLKPLPQAAMGNPSCGAPLPTENAPPEPYRPRPGATAPVVLKSVPAIYNDAARKSRITGACLIRLIVDAQGMPQNVQVIKNLEPSLDQNAAFAVSQYRFKPAMRCGVPMPVMITIEVDFRLY